MPPEIKLMRIRSTGGDVIRAPINGHFELIVEHPFDSTIKRVSTVWQFITNHDQEQARKHDLLLCMLPSTMILDIIDLCAIRYEGRS